MGALNLFRTLFGPDHFPRNLGAVEELKALAAEYQKTLPQFALRWASLVRDPVLRANSFAAVVEKWREVDRDGAERFLREPPAHVVNN